MKINKSILILGLAISMICTGCGSSSNSYYEGASTSSTSDSYSGMDMAQYANSSSSKYDSSYSIAGLGSSKNESSKHKTEEYNRLEKPETEEAEVEAPEINEDAEMTLVEEKLVYYCTMEIETTEYADSYARLKELIVEYGGLIQSEYETDSDYDWYYSKNYNTNGTLKTSIQCRIPSQNYNEFVANISELNDSSKVIKKSTSIENISQQYYDNKTRIDALEIQEERLLGMLEEATHIDDMIAIEDRLTEVQYELNQLNTKLIYMDMDVAFSYVNISLEEVKEYTTVYEETTFFSRLWDNAVDAWEMGGELFEELLSAILHFIPILLFVIIPTIIVIGLLIKLLIWFIKKLNKKYKFMNKIKDFVVGTPIQNLNTKVSVDTLDNNKEEK